MPFFENVLCVHRSRVNVIRDLLHSVCRVNVIKDLSGDHTKYNSSDQRWREGGHNPSKANEHG
eukprot:1190381-Prorocentrum_minimum.AAC.1